MSEWKIYKLGDIATFQTGKLNSNAAVSNGQYPFFTCSPITLSIDTWAFDKEAIILAGNNAEGNFSIKYYKGKFNAYQRTYIIEAMQGICDTKFLYYSLKIFLKHFKRLSQGTSTKFLTAVILRSIEISLPPLAEQKRIADILSAIDDKIELNRRINANLEQQAQALYKSWFGGISSNITLQEITLNITDGVHNTVKDDCSGEYLLLSCKNIVGGHLVIGPNERRINKETFDKLRKRTRLSEGDILVSTVGTVGEIVILLDPPANVEFQRSVGIIKPNISKASPYYIYCALKDKQEALKHTAHGAVQQCIFIGDLKNFEIPYSYSKKLIEFDTIVSPMFNQLTINHRESNYLTQLRDTLLPKLMSGEIAV